ncbi:MAG TPA: hypothetical protein VG755_07050 [Nannocystaceae bacterium]|nr:hypothetical protein [Nannocystaceae bacterium]
MRSSWAACVLAVGLTTAGTASASNGSKPRTPVVWSADACATVVERATTPVLHLAYEVPFEDLGPLSTDEVDDSRTHQFFAFARLDYAAVGTAQRLPPWISDADIERAALVDPEVVPTDIDGYDVLEDTSRFTATEWTRITADDARVPISQAQAAIGVDWDLGGLAPGPWSVWGYTWEPLLNLWAPRPGFVLVVDSLAERDAAGPAIALLSDARDVVTGEPFEVLGCADVAVGSTVTIEWGTADGPIEPQWAALVVDEPITTGALAIAVALPEEAAGEGPGQVMARLRATVTDPSGRSHVAYTPSLYTVELGEAPHTNEGCACTSSAPSSAWWLLVPLLARRRRCLVVRG